MEIKVSHNTNYKNNLHAAMSNVFKIQILSLMQTYKGQRSFMDLAVDLTWVLGDCLHFRLVYDIVLYVYAQNSTMFIHETRHHT